MVNIFSPLGLVDRAILRTPGRQKREVEIYVAFFDKDTITKMFIRIEPLNVALLMSRNDKVQSINGKVIFITDLPGDPEDYMIENREIKETEKDFMSKRYDLLKAVSDYLKAEECLFGDLVKLSTKQKNNGGCGNT